jgi:hypothetical protein
LYLWNAKLTVIACVQQSEPRVTPAAAHSESQQQLVGCAEKRRPGILEPAVT